jgi:hypothetical protein
MSAAQHIRLNVLGMLENGALHSKGRISTNFGATTTIPRSKGFSLREECDQEFAKSQSHKPKFATTSTNWQPKCRFGPN